jgi:hypothetical protein
MSLEDRWDGELLNGSGVVISTKLNVLQHGRMKPSITERSDWVNLDRPFLLYLNALDSVKSKTKSTK